MAKATAGPCVDCPPGSKRRTSRPGPRCASHHRVRRTTSQEAAWAKRIEAVYGITALEYEAIKAASGGRCAICQRANGRTRRMSVDHDHAVGTGRRAVRGILCRPCNSMLGHLRDDPSAFERAAEYLRNPPAHRVLTDHES